MKVLFFGTPDVAVPFLDWLCSNETVVGVVCRPDEPSGRGYKITAPPVKTFALDKNLPVFQPHGPWDENFVRSLKELKADIGIVVAYGRILPETVFMAPKLGCVNIHFSLLPKYRGAAPIQWALINGETKTGVSAFWLEPGLDSGPVFHQTEAAIDPSDDVVTLREKLIKLGLTILKSVMTDAAAGKMIRQTQKGNMVPAPLLKKETGRIDWSKPAASIVNLIRGVSEWPGASTLLASKAGPAKNLKIIKASAESSSAEKSKPAGTIVEIKKDRGFAVKSGDGQVLILEIQPEGKKPMSAWAFWQGAHLSIGDKLG